MNAGTSQVQDKQQTSTSSFVPQEPKYTFQDLILPQATHDEIMSALAAHDQSLLVYEVWGLGRTHRLTRRVGINLYGPPGTGKTMTAHAIAAYLRKRLLIVNYADIESKYVGDTPKNLARAFQLARETGCIVFFDEADAILSRRLSHMETATDTSVNQTRSVLLTLLNEHDGIMLFATNFIANYDPAFMRRILAHIRFVLPDLPCRRRLLEQFIPPEMPTNARVGELAELAEGLSGSEIANAVLLAALRGARSPRQFVEHRYLVEALARVNESLGENSITPDRSTDDDETQPADKPRARRVQIPWRRHRQAVRAK